MNRTNPDCPDVVADNGAHLHIATAMYLWEGGEFSEWAEQNGFPIQIGEAVFEGWDGVEDALIDFPLGPNDPRELDEE